MALQVALELAGTKAELDAFCDFMKWPRREFTNRWGWYMTRVVDSANTYVGSYHANVCVFRIPEYEVALAAMLGMVESKQRERLNGSVA